MPGALKQSAAGRCGFTMVEVLVVLAVIGILAAIVLPVLSTARERGRSIVCLSDLHQLHRAYDMYAADSDGLIPPHQTRLNLYWVSCDGCDPELVPEGADSLVRALWPYTKSLDLWFCPTDPYARVKSEVGNVRHLYTSYASGLFTVFPKPVTMDGPVFGSGTNPSDAILLTDALWEYAPDEPHPPYSHLERYSYLFFDGHAKSYRWQDAALRR